MRMKREDNSVKLAVKKGQKYLVLSHGDRKDHVHVEGAGSSPISRNTVTETKG